MTGVPVSEDHHSLRSLPHDGPAAHVFAVTAGALVQRREELIAVAAQAFGAAPWYERPVEAVRVVDRMARSLGRRDFAAVAALDGPHLTGFAYGYTDTACAALDPMAAEGYDAFEVVELAVATAYQGRGIGHALHDALLAGTTAPRLLLTHPAAPARLRYQAWGWTERGYVVSPVSGQQLVLMRHDQFAAG